MKTNWLLSLYIICTLLGPAVAHAAEPKTPSVGISLLQDRKELPLGLIEASLSSEQWRIIRARPCEGYVLLSASVSPDGKLSNVRVRKHSPDDSLDALALKLAAGAQVKAVSIGSLLPPRAEVAVALLGREKNDMLALVFAHQTSGANPTSSRDTRDGGVNYLNIVTLRTAP